jgi:CubicO group peptidase (beta-lactamase class C family)
VYHSKTNRFNRASVAAMNDASAAESRGRAAVAAALEAAVADGTVPGGVILVAGADHVWEPVIAGVRRYGGERVTADTRYDLASLTKVVGCLSALLRLLDAGALRLEDRVRRFFSNAGWFQEPSLGDVSLEALATHVSGLPAWRPLFTQAADRRMGVAGVLQTPLEAHAGRYRYSDLGVIALTAVIERVAGERIDALLAREVFAPLGMERTGYGPLDPGLPVAATEDDGLRGGVLQGVVHDENAWALEGVSGHAGLFAPAADVIALGRAWLRLQAPFASEGVLRAALLDRSGGEGPRRGLLWRLREADWPFGPEATEAAFGHTGFTGTSLVVEPRQGWTAALLTNRVHPTREAGAGIEGLRRRVHGLVAGAFDEEAVR